MIREDVTSFAAIRDAQGALLDALGRRDPMAMIVKALGRAAPGSCLLFDVDGSILASDGEAPPRLVWEAIERARTPALLRVGRWAAYAGPIPGSRRRWVLAVATRGRDVDGLDALFELGVKAVRALDASRNQIEAGERRERERLLASLEDGVPEPRESRAWTQLAEFGFTVWSPLVAILARASGGEEVLHVVERCRKAARRLRLPLLVSVRHTDANRGAMIHALAPSGAAVERWLTQIGGSLILGRSEPYGFLRDTPNAFSHAAYALDIALARSKAAADAGRPGVSVAYDEMSLGTWLMARADRGQAVMRWRREFGAIEREQVLESTLVTYLACDQSVTAAAAALYVHPNTVRYRLAKVADLCGSSIGATAFVANMHLRYEHVILARRAELGYADPAAHDGVRRHHGRE